jgi:hypothetical protein
MAVTVTGSAGRISNQAALSVVSIELDDRYGEQNFPMPQQDIWCI